MSEEEIYKISGWLMSIIAFVAASWFIRSYINLKEKTYGFKIIFILSVADFFFASTNIVRLICVELDIPNDIFFPLTVFGGRFCLFWSTAIGIFTYLILVRQEAFDAKKFVIKGVLYCTLLSLIFPIM